MTQIALKHPNTLAVTTTIYPVARNYDGNTLAGYILDQEYVTSDVETNVFNLTYALKSSWTKEEYTGWVLRWKAAHNLLVQRIRLIKQFENPGEVAAARVSYTVSKRRNDIEFKTSSLERACKNRDVHMHYRTLATALYRLREASKLVANAASNKARAQ